MRASPHPHFSAHRLARLNAWARLWLVWFVGVCAAWFTRGGRARARDLNWLARGVASVVILNVRPTAKAMRPSRNRHGRVTKLHLRTITGSRLRGALKGRDWASRLVAIVAVMRDLDAHVAALARRLAHGLSRLRVIDPLPACAPPLAPAPLHALACDDSS